MPKLIKNGSYLKKLHKFKVFQKNEDVSAIFNKSRLREVYYREPKKIKSSYLVFFLV